MVVKTMSIKVSSEPETDLIDITDEVSRLVESSGIKNGAVVLFVPGSTASLSTIEYEPNLIEDFKNIMERLVPSDIQYKHKETWGDDNGKSHVRASLVGSSLTVPFKNRKLLLGTWQQIVLMDFDVPARNREIIVQIIGE
ncbi:MAG: YjbQ family protein [Candidatus Aenigmatarchaeota archaeon]|nr:MAG: YjbQ family protein [Candidatus Aenigmarchaeota archaeon]